MSQNRMSSDGSVIARLVRCNTRPTSVVGAMDECCAIGPKNMLAGLVTITWDGIFCANPRFQSTYNAILG